MENYFNCFVHDSGPELIGSVMDIKQHHMGSTPNKHVYNGTTLTFNNFQTNTSCITQSSTQYSE